MLGRRDGRKRRLDATGAGIRFAAQPRRSLRQGRVDPRARYARELASAQVADEARQRQVAEDPLGAGNQRGRRPPARDPQGIRTRRGVLGRLVETQQRTGLPDAQVRVVLRHEQHGSPGANLPFDDRLRRGEHLGLRRDDQFIQRHAEHQVRALHRFECSRSAPGVDAAHVARKGNRRTDDRRRPALHANRGEGRCLCPHPFRHRHSLPVRLALPRLQERLGRQAIHP